MKWARTRVKEDNYYRDIAVYIQMAETFERSIVFTHAEISINEETYTKSEFVTMIITINQKKDKFAGVMFGDNIDDTYRKAWQKVLNPPRLNIYIPSNNNKNVNKEYISVNNKHASKEYPLVKENLTQLHPNDLNTELTYSAFSMGTDLYNFDINKITNFEYAGKI